MVAFEVSINRKRCFVAGHADAQALHVFMNGSFPALSATPGVFGVHGFLAVPGTAEGELHTLSYPSNWLSVGDEVTIRIIEVDRADPPTERNTGMGSIKLVADAR